MINRTEKLSLHNYLNKRYFSVLLLLVTLFLSLIFFTYFDGMDRTTEYYMSYEAEVLSDYYQVNEDIIEFDPERKEYYWGREALPASYQTLLEKKMPDNDTVIVFQHDKKSIYILPLFNLEKNETFYVVHIFKNESFFSSKINSGFDLILQQVAPTLTLIILLLIILYIYRINRHITKQVDDFHFYIKDILQQDGSAIESKELPNNLRFDEFVNTAESLKASLIKQYQLKKEQQTVLQREREFLTSLSHEVRTPIAIIGAATSLIKKRDNLLVQDKKALDKLTKANQKMKVLTQTLLQLWREQPNVLAKEQPSTEHLTTKQMNQNSAIPNSTIYNSTTLGILIAAEIKLCTEHYLIQNLNIKLVNKNEMGQASYVKVNSINKVNVEMLKITVANLLRNACQYCCDGEILVEICDDFFTISNRVHRVDFNSKINTDVSYGYGVGYYLIEKICMQQNWTLSVEQTKSDFSVRVALYHLA